MLLTLAPLQTWVHSVLLSPGTCPRTRFLSSNLGWKRLTNLIRFRKEERATDRWSDETANRQLWEKSNTWTYSYIVPFTKNYTNSPPEGWFSFISRQCSRDLVLTKQKCFGSNKPNIYRISGSVESWCKKVYRIYYLLRKDKPADNV